MHERPTSVRPPTNRAITGTVRLLPDEYRTDIRTLERVAAGIRALPDTPGRPSPGDIVRLRKEFDRVLARLHAAGYEEVHRVR